MSEANNWHSREVLLLDELERVRGRRAASATVGAGGSHTAPPPAGLPASATAACRALSPWRRRFPSSTARPCALLVVERDVVHRRAERCPGERFAPSLERVLTEYDTW